MPERREFARRMARAASGPGPGKPEQQQHTDTTKHTDTDRTPPRPRRRAPTEGGGDRTHEGGEGTEKPPRTETAEREGPRAGPAASANERTKHLPTAPSSFTRCRCAACRASNRMDEGAAGPTTAGAREPGAASAGRICQRRATRTKRRGGPAAPSRCRPIRKQRATAVTLCWKNAPVSRWWRDLHLVKVTTWVELVALCGA